MFGVDETANAEAVELLKSLRWKLVSNDMARGIADQAKLEKAFQLVENFGWVKGEDYGALLHHNDIVALSIYTTENIDMLRGLGVHIPEPTQHMAVR